MEVIARLDENGIATLGTYPADVKVIVELSIWTRRKGKDYENE